jgi:tetrahydrodipicolinate N-succinyltransferase
LYITAGTKIEVYKKNGEIDGVFKGSELSNCSNLVFLRNSQNGKVIAKVSQKSINLNSELHKND